jgi:hypothetical protein
MARNRIIYASQSVIVDGDFLYRVQTLGSSTTFNSTDLFELGQQDVIDVVDDVPTVALTLDTNDWGTVRTAAALAHISTAAFDSTATVSNATLAVVSGTTSIAYYHGVALSNYGVSGSEFDLWAPVQSEAALGSADDEIDQTVFMSRCFATGINLSYSTGGEATENYTAETDNKTWFLNDGRFVSQEEWTTVSGLSYDLGLPDGSAEVASLADSNRAFLYIDPTTGRRSVVIDRASGAREYVPIVDGAATATEAGYSDTTNVVTLPAGTVVGANDTVKIRYASSEYANGTDGDSDLQKANYFTAATDANTGDHSNVGGLRQGQIEIYLVDPDASTDYELSLRLQSVSVAVTLNREALSELGHLKPYDRPVTFPIEINTTVEATAGDLATFAKFAGKEAEFESGSLVDLAIDHLLAKDNLILVVMIYDQTDVEAGNETGARRKVLNAEMAGKNYWVDGTMSTYAAINLASPEREYPLKTVIIPDLKATSEAYNLSQGQNATQSFAFRSTNKMFMVKGYVPFDRLLLEPGFETN